MFLGLAAAAAAPKIEPRVRERAQSEAAVAVFIVLDHQPQREIFQRAESANALYRQVAESRVRQAAGATELRHAREAAEAVTLRTRQQAFQAIEQAVGPEQNVLESRLRGLGATRISRYLGVNMLAAEIPASAIDALEADPEIARVFSVEKLHLQLANSVPALGAPAFWNAGYTGQGESVGVLDTGVKTNHPAFAGVLIVSQVFLANGSLDPCFTDNASSPQDQFGHGTHVAGIVASQGSAGWTNYQGVAKGIGTLYNLKVGFTTTVSSSCGYEGAEGDQRDMFAAVDWAVRNTSVRVFNLSFGSLPDGDDDDFAQTIDQYIDSYGLAFAISAGNGGLAGYGVSSPGTGYNGITVANWVSRGVIAESSSRGPTQGGRFKPDLAAPGTNIYSTYYIWDSSPATTEAFVNMTGTSMAAPHIAGSAALMESAGVTNALAVKALLINTTDNAGWATDRGWGFTNLGTAWSELYYATGSLAAGAVQYYKASLAGDFRATVTWNRHMSGSTSNFNNISLHLYRADTGQEIANALSGIQNVQQLSATYAGDAVLAVTMDSSPLAGVTDEPYAVAFSVPGTPITRTGIDLSCSVPSSIMSGSEFSLTCSVSNSGEIIASALVGQVALPAGFAGPVQMFFGDVPPGAVSSPVSIGLMAPTVAGTYAIRVTVPVWFGKPAVASSAAVVQAALPAPVLISPANGASGVALTTTLSWSAAAGAVSYDVYFGSSMPPPLAATTTTTSYAVTLNPAGVYYWQIVAKNGSGTNASPIWAFTTQPSESGQPYVVVTVAGTGMWGYSGDGGPAISAQLGQPEGVATDAAGNIYIAEYLNNRVRRVGTDGIITTVAGTGRWGYSGDGGPATSAEFADPAGVAMDAAGNLYVSDSYYSVIRKVAPDGTISRVAGTGPWGYSGDGGPATSAQLNNPEALAVDAAGNLYIGDNLNSRVRKVAPDGTITTVAGSGTGGWGYSGDGGPGTSAQISEARALAVDAAGNLYIADTYNEAIRKLTPDGIITTVAGNGTQGYSGDGGPATSAQLNLPWGIAVGAAGNFYIADGANAVVRQVLADGTITTVAGNGVRGYSGDGGPATDAELNYPFGMAVNGAGNIFFSDYDNSAVRVLLPANFSCRYQVDQTAIAVSGAGGTLPIWIETGPGCWWMLAGLPSWIGGKAFGGGSTTVNLVVTANPGTLRTATISIAGTAVSVTQGEGGCTYGLSPSGSFAAGGGTGTLTVTAGPSCPWVAYSTVGWFRLAGLASGVGGGTVSYTVAPNPGGARSGTLNIGAATFTVEQGSLSDTALRFVPVTPCRVADTRGSGGAMTADETRSFDIPQSGCGIPSTAQAYSLNVTVVPRRPLSYLTLWPTGQGQPLVSTLNSFGGIVVANAAIVPAGFNGAVSVYVTDPTDVILDINGYFDSAGTYAFYSVQPCRVADTRGPAGPFGAPALTGAQSRDFPVPSSSCGLPSTASAYSMNVTVVPAGYLGYLKTWPTGQAQPNVSTLNSWTGKVVANAALVPAGSGGSISVYAQDPTEVVLDTNGYFGAPSAKGALNFYPVAPCRVADTRGAAGPKMGDAETRSFPIPSSGCGIPAMAAAYSLNVTVVPDGMLQYLTAWPTGAGQPFASTLNSWDGAVVANAAIVPAGAGGAINVFVANRTHVILDINGYFAP
jgi:subtilisin family serine protease/sugar lactone lactonase YvrE